MLRSIFKRLPLVSAAALALGVATTGIALTQHARASMTIQSSCKNKSTCLGWSNKGVGTAFSGTAISTYAFLGSSQSATGAYFSSKDTTHGYDGVLGTVNGGLAGVGGYGYNGSAGTEGVSDSGAGVYASSGTGFGLQAVSTSGIGAYSYSSSNEGARDVTNTNTHAALVAENTASGGPPFDAYNLADGGYFFVDQLGDGYFSGLVYTAGSCNLGCDKKHGIGEYAKRSSLPTIEDEGEVALRNGSAYVAFDSSFRNVMDANRSYLVTVTPEGDSKGMFVSGKTSAGFFIRENQGGRSNVLVTYKVDARTLDEDRGRLPAMSAPAEESYAPRKPRT